MAQMMTNRKHNAQTLDRHDKKTISLMSSSKKVRQKACRMNQKQRELHRSHLQQESKNL